MVHTKPAKVKLSCGTGKKINLGRQTIVSLFGAADIPVQTPVMHFFQYGRSGYTPEWRSTTWKPPPSHGGPGA